MRGHRQQFRFSDGSESSAGHPGNQSRCGGQPCRDHCESELFDGVANIGYSPTFDDHLFTVEVYILDFDRNIYGHNIRVNFIKRIRDEIKFSGITALSEQIKRDVIEARTILATAVHVQS